MIKFFRKIRFNSLLDSKLTKYLFYAAGEILLVVIGILIALYINNRNQRRIEKEALDGHLQSIAKNIVSDLRNARNINIKRLDLVSKQSYISNNVIPRVEKTILFGTNLKTYAYGKDDIALTGKTIKEIWRLEYLNANTGGFESLKSSGFLSKLHGKDLEGLLQDYYNLISEIALKENNYNELIQSASIEFGKQDFEASFALFRPDYRGWDQAYLESFRSNFQNLLGHSSIERSLSMPYDIVVDYNNLIILGEELVRLIGLKSLDFDAQAKTKIARCYNEFDDVGYPKIIVDGALTSYYSELQAHSQPVSRYQSTVYLNEVQIDFPEMDWGVNFFSVGSGSLIDMATKDYSMYKTLRLELKGETGGERLKISIKDETNPTDGSESKVPLTLSDKWEWYEIPLSSFEGTNLKKLFMPAAFVFEKEAASIRVKNIEYAY